jgi:hypothetical protein
MNEKALEGLKKFRESGQKPVVRTPLEKLKDNPASLRTSITAFCWLCVGEVRKEVTNCTAKNCPLYNVRPWQPKEGSEASSG